MMNPNLNVTVQKGNWKLVLPKTWNIYAKKELVKIPELVMVTVMIFSIGMFVILMVGTVVPQTPQV